MHTRCVRCSAPPVIRVREAAYCAACYNRVFSDKLKNGLDAVRGAIILRDAERPPVAVAIALSGGRASAVLLHAAARFFRAGAHPVRFEVLFVDDSEVSIEGHARRSAAHDVETLARSLADDIVFTRIPIARVLAHGGTVACTGAHVRAAPQTPMDAQRAFTAIYPPDIPRLGAADARTRAQDLLRVYTHRALLETAVERGCTALLLGDTGTRAAAHLLASVARGAGFQLPAATAPVRRTHGVYVAHPLRAHLEHEIAHYAAAHGIAAADVPELVPRTRAAPDSETYEALADKASIERLAECAYMLTALIDALQRGVSSTVSTVARTGEKLVSADAPATRDVPGVLPRIGNRGVALVRAACDVPSWDGSPACTLCLLPREGGAGDAPVGAPADASDVACRLCYACRRTLTLPESVGTQLMPVPRSVVDGDAATGVERLSLAASPSAPVPAPAPAGPPQEPRGTPVALSREDMRGRVADFLL